MDQLQWMAIGGSALVIGFFALRAVIFYARAGDRLAICTRSSEYLIATLDEQRMPDLRYDRLDVDKKLRQLQATLLAAGAAAHRKLRFRRAALDDAREIREALEAARSSTEILPLCGVLGTVVGLLATSFLGREGASFDTSGLWLALISTVLALTATILLKWAYEGRLLPQYAHFEHLNQAIEQTLGEGSTELLAALGSERPATEPAGREAAPQAASEETTP